MACFIHQFCSRIEGFCNKTTFSDYAIAWLSSQRCWNPFCFCYGFRTDFTHSLSVSFSTSPSTCMYSVRIRYPKHGRTLTLHHSLTIISSCIVYSYNLYLRLDWGYVTTQDLSHKPSPQGIRTWVPPYYWELSGNLLKISTPPLFSIYDPYW